jgi:hypothetical protein
MALVRLHRDDADGYLPDVCMCCGEPASALTTKRMAWCPPWVGVLILAGLLPYVIVSLVMTLRATIQAPLCDQHQGHWFNRLVLMWGSAALLGLVSVAGIVFVSVLPQEQDAIKGFVCFGCILLLLAWLIVAIVVQNTAIRPTEITTTHITLTGVSDRFVDAVEDEKAERRARKRSRRSRREEENEEEEEEERPRKKRPPSDAIEE